MDISKEQIIIGRLSIQRALLGEVSPKLRAVVFSIVERNIDVRFYFDGAIRDEDIESASNVEAEIIADYEQEDVITALCIQIDYPEIITDDGVWVYQRREIAI